MIVRLSSAVVSESSLGEYLEYLERNESPGYEAASGLVCVLVLQRRFVSYVEVMTLSLWRSEETLKEFVETRSLLNGAQVEHHSVQLEPRIFTVVEFHKCKEES